MSLNIPSLSSTTKNSPMPKKVPGSVFDKIDVNKIGQGKYLTEGKWHSGLGNPKGRGLKGQLKMMRQAGLRSMTTKNLSDKDLQTIHDLISDRLKKHATSYQASLSSKDQKIIMRNALKLVKTKGNDFSREDLKDLKEIVKSIRQQNAKSPKIEQKTNTILNKSRDEYTGYSKLIVNKKNNQQKNSRVTDNTPTVKIHLTQPILNRQKINSETNLQSSQPTILLPITEKETQRKDFPKFSGIIKEKDVTPETTKIKNMPNETNLQSNGPTGIPSITVKETQEKDTTPKITEIKDMPID